jgi:Helix-turn-helix domain of resolvase
MYREGMDITEAGDALEAWKRRNWVVTVQLDELIRDRDQLIRDAYAAGVNIRQIHMRSGIARSTIYRVLGLDAERDETDT